MLSSKTAEAVKRFEKKNAKLLKELRDLTVRVVEEMVPSNGGLQCCYCVKMYKDSKYLMSHIMRRHPEELLQLHEESGIQERGHHPKKQSKQYVAPLDSAKELVEVMDKLKTEVLSLLEKFHRHHQTMEHSSDHGIENNGGKSETSRQRQVQLLTELQSKCEISVETAMELEKQYACVMNVAKENNNLKDQLSENTAEIQQLRDELTRCREEVAALNGLVDKKFADFKSSVQKEMKCHKTAWDAKVESLNKSHSTSAKELYSQLESKLDKISNEQLKVLEAKFENQLQRYMAQSKLLAVKPAERPQRSRSIPKSEDLKAAQRKIKEMYQTIKPALRTIRPTYQTVKPSYQTIKPAETVSKKHKKNASLDLDEVHKQSQQLVKERLHNFGIPSVVRNLTVDDLDKKDKDVQMETKFLQCKYNNYQTVRKNLEKQVDNKVNAFFLEKVAKKKITFAPSVDTLPSTSDLPPVKVQAEVPEKESSEFIVVDKSSPSTFIVHENEEELGGGDHQPHGLFASPMESSLDGSNVSESGDSASQTEAPGSSLLFMKDMKHLSKALYFKNLESEATLTNDDVVAGPSQLCVVDESDSTDDTIDTIERAAGHNSADDTEKERHASGNSASSLETDQSWASEAYGVEQDMKN